MRPKHLYLGLCLAGTILPYSQFIPFLREHGLSERLCPSMAGGTGSGAFGLPSWPS
jgi:hypothetical protein